QRGGIADLARTLAQLAALGYPVDLTRWDDEIDPDAVPAKKPALTVPICGANHVKPKPARPPRPIALAAPAPRIPDNPVAPSPQVQPRAAESPPPSAPTPKKREAMANDNPAFVHQALQTTQENLVALQKLGEQTAKLH